MRQPAGWDGGGGRSGGLSLDTRPASRSSSSAWNTVKDVTDVPSSLGQCQMMSSFPSGLYQHPTLLFLSHSIVSKAVWTPAEVLCEHLCESDLILCLRS